MCKCHINAVSKAPKENWTKWLECMEYVYWAHSSDIRDPSYYIAGAGNRLARENTYVICHVSCLFDGGVEDKYLTEEKKMYHQLRCKV